MVVVGVGGTVVVGTGGKVVVVVTTCGAVVVVVVFFWVEDLRMPSAETDDRKVREDGADDRPAKNAPSPTPTTTRTASTINPARRNDLRVITMIGWSGLCGSSADTSGGFLFVSGAWLTYLNTDRCALRPNAVVAVPTGCLAY